MKILFLTRLFFPNIGGVQNHVLEISKRALLNGHSVSIITEKYSKNLKNNCLFQKINIYRIPVNEKKERLKKIIIWSWLIRHKDIIKDSDIIHVHDVGYWIFPLKLIFPKKNFYITFHGYEPNKYKKLKSRYEKKITEKITQGSIAVGLYLKKLYGINPKKIVYGASSANEILNKNKKYSFDACFVGRLEYDTGILEYIKAIKFLQNKFKIRLNVVICGKGSLFEDINKYVKKNNLSVKLVGWQKNPLNYMVESKIVFSSQYLSILDALQLKKMVFSVYKNKIKKNYLMCLPISKNILISNNYIDVAKNIKYFL
ncbi:MAG: glycosyl transferase, group 1 family protein, partial [Microgenomates bacterium 39_6]